jgi:two-component system response regulator YesN
VDKIQPFKTLIVEDEALIRRNISKKIRDLNTNFSVMAEAIDGHEALKLMEYEIPHLVITDIQMPVMNGLELARNIYFAYPNTKVVILSGHNEFEFARQAIAYQVEDYLLKPVTSETLLSTLSKVELKLRKDYDSLIQTAHALSHNISQEDLVVSIEMFIKENYDKNLSLKEIANRLNFSVDYLSKIFKKYRDETPIKYMTRLRINEAKRILNTHPDMDIKTVGELVGYADPYYFSRVFKNNTNYYPSEFRALKQN